MISADRSYLQMEMRAADDNECRVEGYAMLFECRTVIDKIDGIEYCEVMSRGCLDHAQMTDVVMNYNHSGKPVARTKNGTLKLQIDERGLKITAVLAGTAEGRKMYEEIQGKYIDQMSFCFIADRAADTYDTATHTRRINKIDRVYDVAAVDIPAYQDTIIEARSAFFKAEAAKIGAEATERRRKYINLKIIMEE